MRATPFPILYPLRRVTMAAFALLVAGPVLADDDRSLTQKLLDADAKVALQKLQQELDKNAPPPPMLAAPAGAAAAMPAAEHAPQTIALYGVDGRAAGGAMTLRSYVRWGDQVYPAKVGGKWRGYTVSAISESGTTFTRGKAKLFAPVVQDDAVALLNDAPGKASAAGSVPLPIQGSGQPIAHGTPPYFPMPSMGPGPGAASTLPTPFPSPPTPAMPTIPAGPGSPSAGLAQR
ncbi:hypothetical protein [Cupriavidus pinatubonensis]|uniref:hypothetical protein n=1 Tax=Cupriavidus pinatubonensis TaxID=248026 RepID=UPI00360CA971